MIRHILFFLSCFLSISANSQVVISLQVPEEGVAIRSQLWNATIINSENSGIYVKINLSLADINTGQQVISGTTSLFYLQQGATAINSNIVTPVSYFSTGMSGGSNMAPDDYLPIGTYNLCYQLLKQKADGFENIGEECAAISVAPLSPPILNTPDDAGIIEGDQPFFTWTPPAPANLFGNLSYSIRLTEVLQGQSINDAIQANVPIIFQNNFSAPFLQYPPTSSKLDTGKIYVWQVTANSNNQPVSKSEVWSFSLKTPDNEEIYNNRSGFIKLKRSDAIPSTVCYKNFHFEYTNESNDTLVLINLVDLSGNHSKQIHVSEDFSRVQFGENYKTIDLTAMKLKDGHYYLLRLTNSKNENWYAKFQFKK